MKAPTLRWRRAAPLAARKLQCLFEAAAGDFVFIPAEIMPQFMQESKADLVPEHGLIAFGQIPDVFDKEQYLRGQGLGVGEFTEMFMAYEQTQEVRLAALAQQGVAGMEFAADGHSRGGRAHLGGQAAPGGGHSPPGDPRELLECRLAGQRGMAAGCR